jgi:hypothetical protein
MSKRRFPPPWTVDEANNACFDGGGCEPFGKEDVEVVGSIPCVASGHPRQYYASVLHALRGEPAIARLHAERCLTLSEEHGFRQWRGLSRAVRGICAAVLEPSGTIDQAIVGLDEYSGAGYQFGITALFMLLGEALLLRGQAEAVPEIVEQGLTKCRLNNEVFLEAEFYRLKARYVLLGNQSVDAQSLLEKAVAIARSQNASSLELRAARDLAWLWRSQGRLDDARGLSR